jgi:asparagine synthase (glutamine-hydrolysing)
VGAAEAAVVIGWLRTAGPPSDAVVRRALEAVPYPTPTVTLRTLGNATLGIATRPDYVDEHISAPGDLIAAICGRIDNAADLASDATIGRHLPEAFNDADLVVAAFRARGVNAVDRFRGGFSGTVTDGASVWWFRDHVGFKPLFFRDDPTSLIVAGEARQVVVAAELPEEPNLEVAKGMYMGGLPSSAPAALKGVRRLAQAAYASRTPDGSISLSRYWAPWELFETSRLSVDEAEAKFLVLLDRAVRRTQTGNDVVLLSGGLDSPAIAAYAAPEHTRRSGRPIGALSAVFPDLPTVDESDLIELCAARYGMKLHTYRPQAKALDDVEEWSRRFASPVPTLSIPEVYEAYALARSHGYTNVLTGEFAELTYGKYPHALSHLLFRGRWLTLWRMIQSEHRRTRGSRRELVQDALSGFVPGKVANRRLVARGQNSAEQIPSWTKPGVLDADLPRPDLMPPGWDRYRTLQMWGFEGCTVTMDADATCAAIAGVTVRRPFADVDLWEFFMSLRAEVKFPTMEWKSLARRALRGVVPDEILDRRKKTFFDPHVQSQIDYPLLERLLVAPRHQIAGVDYAELAQRLRARDLSLLDWMTVRELARVHAFLNAW